MKAKDVKIGERYVAKVSSKLTTVTLLQTSPCGGWDAFNETTGKRVRIKTAAWLRGPAYNHARHLPADSDDEGGENDPLTQTKPPMPGGPRISIPATKMPR